MKTLSTRFVLSLLSLLLLLLPTPTSAAQHKLVSPAFISSTVEGSWSKFEDASLGDLDDDLTSACLKAKSNSGSIVYDIGESVSVSKIQVRHNKWNADSDIEYGSGTVCSSTFTSTLITSSSTCTPSTGRSMRYIRLKSNDEEFKICEIDVWIDCANTGEYFENNRCHACPAGSYCPNENSAPTLCPAGKYGATERLASSSCSGNCDAGRYGSSDGLTASSCTGACDPGYWCPAGTTTKNVNACGAGRYGDSPGLGTSACSGLCAAGHYGESESMTVATCSGRCDAGYYCPAGTSVKNANACPKGRYGETTGLFDADCTAACPAGRFGSSTALTSSACSGLCDAGHYGSSSGQTESTCSGACPKGYYCPAGTTDPNANPCPAGRYGSTTGLSDSDCSGVCSPGIKCLAGTTQVDGGNTACHTGPEFYCPGGTGPILVPEGSYSTGGTDATRRTDMLRCEPGHFCTGGVKSACSLGRYGNADGGASTDCENACDVGYFCPVAAREQTQCGSTNLYCPLNAVAPVPVPDGFFSTPADGDVNTRSGVQICPPGSYCVSGVQSICLAGSYGESSGLDSPGCDGPCASGYYCGAGATTSQETECGSRAVYCDAGSSTPTPVDAGFYAVSCLSDTTCGAQSPCEPGSWCSAGVKTPCAAGKWATDAQRSTECVNACDPGYFCPAGSSSGDAQVCGAANVFCATGSGSSTVVSPGFFTTPADGDVTTRSGQQQCGPGTYCSNGVANPCPAGVFGASLGQRSDSCDGPCPAGYFCPEGTVNGTSHPCGAANRYCPTRSATFATVEPGSYTTPVDADPALRTGSSLCESGHVCPGDGSRTPCPVGRFSAATNVSTTCAGECVAGTFCPAGSSAPENCGTNAVYCPFNDGDGATERLAVPTRFYSTGGPDNGLRRTDVAPCEAGYVCVDGARSPCGDASVYCPALSVEAIPAPEGTYTVGSADPALRTGWESCPPGSYCVDGKQEPCPAGTFGTGWNLTDPTCSGRCPDGYHCEEGTVNRTATPCDDPLFYCPEDQDDKLAVSTGFYATTTDAGLYKGQAICPAGSYCVGGVEFLCPAGFMGTADGASSIGDCEPCTAGFFCEQGAFQTDTGVRAVFACTDPAFFCPEQSAAPTPVTLGFYSSTSHTSQNPCPQGQYCVTGVRFDCPAGRFGNVTTLSSSACTGPCPPGTQCAARSVTPEDCVEGSYCEGFEAVPQPCPTGRYGAASGLILADDCSVCGAGRYNPTAGSSVATDCLLCPGPNEGSIDGSTACWPGLLYINASDPGELDPDVVIGGGLTDNDFVDFTFSKATNQAPYTSGDVLKLVNFSTSLATQYFPSWHAPNVLRVTLRGTQDTNRLASAIGRLQARVLALPTDGSATVQGITDPTDTANPSSSGWVPVYGSWGVARMPELIKVTAVDTGLQEGFGASDTLVLEFQDPTNQPPLDNMFNVLELNTPGVVVTAMTGEWTTPRVMTVTIDAVAPSAFADDDAAEATQAAMFYGTLNVTMLAQAGILSQDEESPPSNSTLALLRGSWGEPPCSLSVSVLSATALQVMVHGVPRVSDAQFEVEWMATFDPDAADAWATLASSSGRLNMTGTVGVFNITGLATGVPVYVRAAQTLGSSGLESQATALGMWLEYSSDAVVAVGDTEVDCRGSVCRMCGCQDAWLPRTPDWDALFPPDFTGTADGVLPSVLQEYCRSVSPAHPIIRDVVVDAVGGTLSTTGGEVFRLSGYHFGVAGASSIGVDYTNTRFLFTASGCFLEAPDLEAPSPLQHVQCRSAVGFGDGHAVRLMVNAQTGLLSNATVPPGSSNRYLNYSNPIVNEFAGPAGVAADSTRGNQTLVIIGQHFGPAVGSALESVVASTVNGYRFVASSCAVTKDHLEVTCLTPPGAGSPLTWTVTVAGLASKVPSTSYGVPVVLGAEPAAIVTLLDTAGGQTIDVVGKNFGPPALFANFSTVDLVSLATRAVLPLACDMVTPHTRLRCVTPTGSGERYRARVTFLDQSSDVAADDSPNIAYATPAITTLLLCPGGNCATLAQASTLPSQGSFILIEGTSFGGELEDSAVTVRGGTVTANSLRMLEAHTKIELEVVPDGDAAAIEVAVGLPTWTEDELVFHTLAVSTPEVSTAVGDDPVISLEPGPPPSDPASYNATALALVEAAAGLRLVYTLSLPGTSLGNDPLATTVTLCAPVTDPGCWCVVTHFTTPHQALECRGVFQGTGPLVISAHTRTSAAAYTFVYEVKQPVVLGVVTRPPTSGGVVDMTGNSLFEGSSVPVVTLIDRSSPGAVHAETSDDIRALLQTPGLVTYPCTTNTTVSNADFLRCHVGQGAGAYYWVAVKARGLYGMSAEAPLSALFSYASPAVTAVTPPTGSTGGVRVTLTGSSFATPALAGATVTIGSAPCALVSQTHTQIVCDAPAQLSSDAGLPVNVEVAGLTTSLATTVNFVYDGPVVYGSSPAVPVVPTEGGTNVTLWGDNFGAGGQLSAVSYAENAGPGAGAAATFTHSVVWNNRTMAVVSLGSGYGVGVVLHLSNSMRTANTSVTVDYRDPEVTALELPSSLPAVGGFTVVVLGSSFSTTRTVTVGGRPCVVQPDPAGANPHTSVACTAPPGIGVDRMVVVTALGGRSSLGAGGASNDTVNPNAMLSYDAPVLTAAEAFGGAFGMVDATRETEVIVNGANFLGDPVLDALAVRDVSYAGLPCTVADGGWTQDVTVACSTTGGVPTGVHNLTVSIAGQASAPVTLEAFCPEDFYGKPGQLCQPCPVSSSGLQVAVCRGQYADPIAREGFFRLSQDTFRECVPVSACPEGSGYELDEFGAPDTESFSCGDGYKGLGCSECALKYYRLDERCEPCPSTAWIYMLLFVVGLSALLGLAYWFNKMQLNLAGLSIGIDFAQIVAMFAAFDFAWPVALRRSLNSVSASNFNLQILAPECSVTFTFKDKWLVVQSVPVTLILVLGVIYIITVVRAKMSRAARQRAATTGGRAAEEAQRRLTANTVVGMFFTLMYYMYLVLTKNTLSIFDCTELEDGTKILDEDNSIECDGSDPTYALLRPLAYVSLVLLVIGIPLLFVIIIYQNRESMNADQTLREQNRGQTAEDNPHFLTRQRYQKLYNDFRPGCCHWRLVIMVRKFGLAFVALMFSKNPMFQASFCVLIMFVAYILHARHQPFLSSRPIPDEIKEAVASNQSAKRELRGKVLKRQYVSMRAKQYQRLATFAQETKSKGLVFVFDYNRLESALLICATAILVGGMVFESGSNDCYDSKVVEPGSALYVFLTVVLIIGLALSMMSFIGILIWEIFKSLKHARMYRKGLVAKKKLTKLTENPLGRGRGKKKKKNKGGGLMGLFASKKRGTPRPTIPVPQTRRVVVAGGGGGGGGIGGIGGTGDPADGKATPDSEMKRMAAAPMRTRGGGGGGATAPSLPGAVGGGGSADSAAGGGQ